MVKLDTPMVEMQKIVFQTNRYSMSWLENKIGAFAKDRFEYRESERFDLDAKLREFTTQMLERKLVEDSYPTYYSYRVPSNWWEHLKLEKAPKWFTKRYPVNYENKRIKRVVKITRKATYPMADIIVPKNMGEVVIKDVVSPLNFYEEED